MKFLIALETGGLMESPELVYYDFEIVDAKTPNEATQIYNEKNKCSYFYGTIMAYKDENGETKVVNENLTFKQLRMLDD